MLNRPAENDMHIERRSDSISFRDIRDFIWRNLLTIALSTAICLAIAAAYIVLSKPTYTARAQLLINTRLPLSLHEQSGESVISLDTPQVESQVMVLRSEAILTNVVRNLGLMNDPEYQDPNRGRSFLAKLWKKPQPATTDYDRLRRAIGALQRGLDIRRVGLSYAIDISYSCENPRDAARIANEVAEAFVKDQIASRSRAARQGSAWLEARIDELRFLMNSSALLVQKFKAKRDYRIVNPENSEVKEKRKSNAASKPEPREETTLNELESKASTYRKIYESFLQAYTESVQRQSFPGASARVITVATPPTSKSHPKTVMLAALGGMLGLLIGFGIALVRENLRDSA